MPRTPTIVGTFLAGERSVGWSRSTSWVYSVRVNGEDVNLASVLADVTIRQGRDEADDAPRASSASIAVWPVTRAITRAFAVGGVLELDGEGPPGIFPLFFGIISDAELDVDVLSITAAGVLANANRAEMDVTAWPAERWSARAARLFDTSPFDGIVEADPHFDPILEPPVNLAGGTILFETYAQSLAAAGGAAIVDTPDGKLRAQMLGHRAATAPTTYVHELDPAIVTFAPVWRQSLDVVNVMAIQYGPDSSVQTLVISNQTSIDEFGRRGGELESTRIQSPNDANIRVTTALNRRAFPRWKMHALELLEPIGHLAVGDRVHITGLPSSAPSAYWTPILEGWTHRISGPDWTLELALSDPQSSGLAVQWSNLPPEVRWNTVPPLEWWDANELDDFLTKEAA